MTADSVFHLFFLAILALLGSVRVHYRRQLRRTAGGWPRKKSTISKEIRELAAIVAAVLVAVHAMSPQLLGWSDVSLWPAIRWIAVIVAIAGIPWLWWAATTAAKVCADQSPDGWRANWNTAGPYRLTRYPVYAGVILEVISLVVISANWIIAIVGVIWAGHIFRSRLPREEIMRRRFFGAAYEEYCAKTPRLLPFPVARGRSSS